MRICFSESPPGIFRFVTLPLEIPEKTRKPHPLEILLQNDTPWKFQDQKPRPHAMEIPHEFFLNNVENSTSFLIGYSQKKTKMKRGLRTYFFETPHEIFRFFTPENSRQNKTSPLEIPQSCVTPIGNFKA